MLKIICGSSKAVGINVFLRHACVVVIQCTRYWSAHKMLELNALASRECSCGTVHMYSLAREFTARLHNVWKKTQAKYKTSAPLATSANPFKGSICAYAISTEFLCTCPIWAWLRQNLSLGVCEQQKRRPACAPAQSDQRLCYSLIVKYHI